MGIIRTAPRDNFTVLPNQTLNDTRLSWRAVGMLAYLLSKPSDWQIQIKQLTNERNSGRDAVYAILNELIEAEYVQRHQVRSDDGLHGAVEYLVFDRPAPPFTVNPDADEPDTDQPHTANPDVYKELIDTKNGKDTKTERDKARACGNANQPRLPMFAGTQEPVPDDFQPNQETLHRIRIAGAPAPTPEHVQLFVTHYQSTGQLLANWQPRFVKWMISERGRKIPTGTGGRGAGRDRAAERRERFGKTGEA